VNPLHGRLVVSIHDVAASSTEATAAWSADLTARGVPATLLTIGGPWRGPDLAHAPDLASWLRTREGMGDEIAYHGWHHQAGRTGPRWRRAVGHVVARGAAEFAALEESDARERLERGISVLEDSGLHVVGFTPPGWLASPGSRRACAALGFRYSTSQAAVIDHRSRARHRIPAFCHRPGDRWEASGAALLRRGTAYRARRGSTVRIALHPADLERPGLREAALAAIDVALDAGLQPTTYKGLLDPRVSA
jgi:uncharacterized protein